MRPLLIIAPKPAKTHTPCCRCRRSRQPTSWQRRPGSTAARCSLSWGTPWHLPYLMGSMTWCWRLSHQPTCLTKSEWLPPAHTFGVNFLSRPVYLSPGAPYALPLPCVKTPTLDVLDLLTLIGVLTDQHLPAPRGFHCVCCMTPPAPSSRPAASLCSSWRAWCGQGALSSWLTSAASLGP